MNYSEMVAKLSKDGEFILDKLTPAQMHLIHMIIGVSGEVGEALDAIKKHVIYSQELDMCNIVEELGDIEFYLEGLRQGLGVTRDECLTANMEKLSVRYEGFTYSDTAAKNRADKEES